MLSLSKGTVTAESFAVHGAWVECLRHSRVESGDAKVFSKNIEIKKLQRKVKKKVYKHYNSSRSLNGKGGKTEI